MHESENTPTKKGTRRQTSLGNGRLIDLSQRKIRLILLHRRIVILKDKGRRIRGIDIAFCSLVSRTQVTLWIILGQRCVGRLFCAVPGSLCPMRCNHDKRVEQRIEPSVRVRGEIECHCVEEDPKTVIDGTA